MNSFSKPFQPVRAHARCQGAGVLRQWFPVIILLTLLTTGMGVMAECSTVGGTVEGHRHALTDSGWHHQGCCHHHKPFAPGSKTGCIHMPLSTVNDFSIDRWNLPLSAETDLPDLDPMAIKTKKSLIVFIPESGPIFRPVSERRQTFTPLYLAHKSLLC
ncbi:hypothetical protein [uncultured Desulfosarcina sp.]|uniref:hypothetical protein n=1 Tax=uncultured Desulfosarcina sp. TaxID=218289 RepID=UPI0029C6D8F0|nr:hypothetical protein [uncultured Desulfosarcina sp.]